MNDQLNDLRNEIDRTDEKIISLLGKRLKLSKKIGEAKKSLGMKTEDKEREQKVLENVISKGKEKGIDEAAIKSIYGIIIKNSKKMQK